MNATIYAPVFNLNAELETIINGDFLLQKPLTPFDTLSVEFLSGLSKRILGTKKIKTFPELTALGFWLRRSNIISIVNSFQREISDSAITVPRGVAFHIAPSNVDSIFLYSWALSLLAGNLNIVRVTQNLNKQMELLLSIIRDFLQAENWDPIYKRNIILTYPREESINRFISLQADVRVLWGGDETIKNIKALPVKPATKDISFADKFSYAIIKSSKYNSLNEEGRAELAKNFYNDAYWFDQMACSSPRFVLFTGNQIDNEKASNSFWDYLGKELDRKKHEDTIDVAMEKLVYMYEAISNTNAEAKPDLPGIDKPSVLRVNKNEITKFRESCGGGFFFESFLEDLNSLSKLVSRKDQTLAYYGFEKNELTEFAKQVNGTGIDRIVPIGQALNFTPIWDGYSILGELTKKVKVI
jgi:hypothetical protein